MWVAHQASRRSAGSPGRYFWNLGTVAFGLLAFSEALLAVGTVFPPSHFIQSVSDVLFVFWYAPLAMALFLDVDFAEGRFDWLRIFDFIQAMLFWVVVYLYFSYSPRGPHPLWKWRIGYGKGDLSTTEYWRAHSWCVVG